MTAGTEQAKADRDTLDARIRELEVAAVTYDGDMGVVMRAVWSSRGLVAAGEDKANSAKTRAREMLDKIS